MLSTPSTSGEYAEGSNERGQELSKERHAERFRAL